MDYGVEVPSYRRIDNEKKTKKINFENGLLGLLIVLFSGVMISRVGFGFVEGLYLAPFGISYFLAMVKKNDIKKSLLIFVSVVIGYLTGYSREKDVIIYVSILTIVLLCKVIFTILKKNFKSNIAFMAIIISGLVIGISIGEQSLEINAVFSLIKSLVVVPIFYILNYGIEVIGYKFGYRGLYNNDFVSLNLDSVAGILHRGGTILYSSNKDNLFDYLVEENGVMVKKDVSDVANENLKREGVDVLVVIGGDGTLTSARDFARKGVNVIGVPKTIDNDLSSTDVTFGFNTAIDVATEALDRLHTTAESHHRIMICEVMGRNAGWIALESGIAGSADVILLPEIPYDIKKIEEKVRQREAEGRNFTIIVVAEGAKPKDGDVVVSKIVSDSPDPIRLGGIGNKLADDLEKLIKDHEVRCTVLGHVQRGGNTCTYDRILSTRYGVAAMELIIEGKFGQMVCLKGDTITNDTLENVIGQNTKKVNPEGELVQVAKKIGITFAE